MRIPKQLSNVELHMRRKHERRTSRHHNSCVKRPDIPTSGSRLGDSLKRRSEFVQKKNSRNWRAVILSPLLSGSDVAPALSFFAVGLNNGPEDTKDQILDKMEHCVLDLARFVEVNEFFLIDNLGSSPNAQMETNIGLFFPNPLGNEKSTYPWQTDKWQKVFTIFAQRLNWRRRQKIWVSTMIF